MESNCFTDIDHLTGWINQASPWPLEKLYLSRQIVQFVQMILLSYLCIICV